MHELTERVIAFYRDYYRNEIGVLAQHYPKEQTTLTIDYSDVFQWDQEIAADYLDKPTTMREFFEDALRMFDLPADVSLDNATVQLVNIPQSRVYVPQDLSTDVSGYVAIRGNLGRVTSKDEFPLEAAFECQRCGNMTFIPQEPNQSNEPHECQGCERQGPFKIKGDDTHWSDYCKVRVETPPDESGSANAEVIDGYCMGELVHEGGEYGLMGRAGESILAYGTIERQRKEGIKKDQMLFERVLNVEAIEFPSDDNRVDIDTHKETFRELSERNDAIDLLSESIAPALYQTDAWETAMEWAVAYLFGAPRIELPDGTVYRGDIHGAIISDYGMGKSMFSHGIENLSPQCMRKSATSLSSDVGLTAAAVKDDFGAGQWTLKPGILVRGNGGHVILDEIDKGPKNLETINDAIEGQQQVNVEKAGLSATYNSRVGLLVLGNPKEGRFNEQPIAPQIGVDSSLLSRFDGIITMEDNADEDMDAKIAEQMGYGYAEANQLEFGDLDESDLDALSTPVDPAVARAWVAYARENCNPTFSKEMVDEIKEWYATEVRQLNNSTGMSGTNDADRMPVPVTARVVMWSIRFSMAFARCHLRDEVVLQDVERAKSLTKRLVKQNWDGEKFDPRQIEGDEPSLRSKLKDAMTYENWMFPSQIAVETKQSEDTVRDALKMAQRGEMTLPVEEKNGKWKLS